MPPRCSPAPGPRSAKEPPPTPPRPAVVLVRRRRAWAIRKTIIDPPGQSAHLASGAGVQGIRGSDGTDALSIAPGIGGRLVAGRDCAARIVDRVGRQTRMRFSKIGKSIFGFTR